MRQAGLILEKFGVPHEIRIMSSSRNPDLVDEYARTAVDLVNAQVETLQQLREVSQLKLEIEGKPVQVPGVSGTVQSVEDGVAVIESQAEQAGRRIIRNAVGEVAQ